MPVLDQLTTKKLVLTRQIYQQSVIQSIASNTSTNKALAVIGFDLAIETMLKISLISLDNSKTPKESLADLIQQVDSALSKKALKPISFKRQILDIHKTRNRIQHEGKYPTEEEVEESRINSRQFLSDIISNIWATEFNNISLSSLISHEEIKKVLATAEEEYKNQNFKACTEQCAIALYIALSRVKNVYVGRPFNEWQTGVMLTSEYSIRNIAHLQDALTSGQVEVDLNLAETINTMQNTLLYLGLGMNYPDYLRFREITGTVYMTADMKYHFNNEKETVEPIEAEFVLSYCTNAIHEIETRVGDIENPFGRSYIDYL